MEEQEALRILSETGAVLKGHFVLASGRHASGYINKDAVYPHTQKTSMLCLAIAEVFKHEQVEIVIAPAVGGVILSQWVAYFLDYPVLGIYAEKSDDGQSFLVKRGYDKLIRGKRVLVVEDVLTTGGSVKKVVEAVRALVGEVVGVGALCNRGGVTTKEIGDVPSLFALTNILMDSWPEEECPLCQRGVPINTEVGKGREFLAHQKAS